MMDVMGADALVTPPGGELDLMQYRFLYSRAVTSYGGANEIQRNIVRERVLGLAKDSLPKETS